MLTYKEIGPVADELVARWEKMDRTMRDPNYPRDVYGLARQYLNALLNSGLYSEALLRRMTPAEIIDAYNVVSNRSDNNNNSDA